MKLSLNRATNRGTFIAPVEYILYHHNKVMFVYLVTT